MIDTIVFGGWAVPPNILEPIFGANAHYIDINRIMPALFDGDQLKSHWQDMVLPLCNPTNGNPPAAIAGWSSGSMFAYAAARACNPQNLTLFSATPSFCRRGDFRFGAHPSVLDRMIDALGHDMDAVLRSFYERCGLLYDHNTAADYTTAELISGLQFLKQADLRPIEPLSVKPTFHHGRDDVIIPSTASTYFCEQTNGEHIMYDGGHTFFI